MTVTPATEHSTEWVGADLPRKEDPALVRGSVTYVDDVTLPGMLHAAVLRSPHAHARIVSIDIGPALALPGVHAVLTHADVPGEKTYGLEFPDQPVLAFDKVRYHGEPVALVAADHPEQARRPEAEPGGKHRDQEEPGVARQPRRLGDDAPEMDERQQSEDDAGGPEEGSHGASARGR